MVGSSERHMAERIAKPPVPLPTFISLTITLQYLIIHWCTQHRRHLLITAGITFLLGYAVYLVFAILNDFYRSVVLIVITSFVVIVFVFAILKRTKLKTIGAEYIKVTTDILQHHWKPLKWYAYYCTSNT